MTLIINLLEYKEILPCQELLCFLFLFSLIIVIFLEKEMATSSSILAWKIPWMEEPCRLQSMGLQSVRHN